MLAALYRECLHHFHESVCHDFLLSTTYADVQMRSLKKKPFVMPHPFLPSEKYNPMINICLVHESEVILV